MHDKGAYTSPRIPGWGKNCYQGEKKGLLELFAHQEIDLFPPSKFFFLKSGVTRGRGGDRDCNNLGCGGGGGGGGVFGGGGGGYGGGGLDKHGGVGLPGGGGGGGGGICVGGGGGVGGGGCCWETKRPKKFNILLKAKVFPHAAAESSSPVSPSTTFLPSSFKKG